MFGNERQKTSPFDTIRKTTNTKGAENGELFTERGGSKPENPAPAAEEVEPKPLLYDHGNPTKKTSPTGRDAGGARDGRNEPPKPPTREGGKDGGSDLDNNDDNSGGSDRPPTTEGEGKTGENDKGEGRSGGLSVDLGGRTHESGQDIRTLVQPMRCLCAVPS